MRKRRATAGVERAGINAVEAACLDLNLIWRDLLQEDVGVDGTIEIVLGEFPSGKLVAAQVKSGRSYMHAEASDSFKFYPRIDDLTYWRQLSIPLFLLVYDPDNKVIYWLNVTKYIEERAEEPLGNPYLQFKKENTLNKDFAEHLKGLFDLAAYDEFRFGEVQAELETLSHVIGESAGRVTITGLSLFIEGLWGLCSKLQFHSSLLADIVRKAVLKSGAEFLVRYSFARVDLYPFIIGYISILSKHHLAIVDAADVNESLYRKLELPTFIAPLTTNGRRFVEYLRASGCNNAHDNQFFTLTLIPHEQIEVYLSFDNDKNSFGPYTDVVGISFNPHLDYYNVQHWKRFDTAQPPIRQVSQHMYYFELIDYIDRTFGAVDRDRILLRHLEIPVTPLICWLEDWYGLENHIAVDKIEGKSNAESYGLHDELVSIFGAAGAVRLSEPEYAAATVSEWRADDHPRSAGLTSVGRRLPEGDVPGHF